MRIGKLWSLSAVSPKEGPYSRRMECREEGEATHPRSGGGGEARGRENSDGTHREARAATPPSAASRPLPSAVISRREPRSWNTSSRSPLTATLLFPRASSSPRRDGVTLTLPVEKPETGGRRRRRPEPGSAERGRCLECGTRRARSPPRRRSSL